MGKFDEIIERVAAFEAIDSYQYETAHEFDAEFDRLEPPEASAFWTHVQGDLGWCLKELAKYKKSER